MNTKSSRIAAASLTSDTGNRMKQNYQNPQGEDKKNGNTECIECQLQWKVLLLGSVCKHDTTLQHHVSRAILQSHHSPVMEYEKTFHTYLGLITVMLVTTEQPSDCTNCHSHHYTHHSLIFNDNRVPAYCVGVHQIIYLIFIYMEYFSPSQCRQRKSGKGPWTALVTVTKQYWNSPCCSIKCRLLWLLKLSEGKRGKCGVCTKRALHGGANTAAAGSSAAPELPEEEYFQKTYPLLAFTHSRGKSRTAMQHQRLFIQTHLQGSGVTS